MAQKFYRNANLVNPNTIEVICIFKLFGRAVPCPPFFIPESFLKKLYRARGDSMLFKKIEKVVGLQQLAGRDYVLSIE